MGKIILDLCGGTGSWSKPFAAAGYEVYVITLPKYNILNTVFQDGEIWFRGESNEYLKIKIAEVYGILAAPPCTMFSFARTKAKTPRNLNQGMETVLACLKVIWACQEMTTSDQQKISPLKFWALENPYWGMLTWFLGKPAFEFNPYEFGDRYQKHTAIWGHFRDPKKNPITLSPEEKHKFSNNSQALPKLPDDYVWGDLNKRAAARAITPKGFAEAFFKANH